MVWCSQKRFCELWDRLDVLSFEEILRTNGVLIITEHFWQTRLSGETGKPGLIKWYFSRRS
jgi:hypothetical protein